MQCSKDSSSTSTKLEKADILELTVDYLRTVSSQNAASRTAQGYVACLNEVDNFFRNSETPTSSTTTSVDKIRRLRAELMAQLSGRAASAVGLQKPRSMPVPETAFKSSPLTSSSPSPSVYRRVLTDRNSRPLPPTCLLTTSLRSSRHSSANSRQFSVTRSRDEHLSRFTCLTSSSAESTSSPFDQYLQPNDHLATRRHWYESNAVEVNSLNCVDMVDADRVDNEEAESENCRTSMRTNFERQFNGQHELGDGSILNQRCAVDGESMTSHDDSGYEVASMFDGISQSAMWRPW